MKISTAALAEILHYCRSNEITNLEFYNSGYHEWISGDKDNGTKYRFVLDDKGNISVSVTKESPLWVK